MPTAGSAAQANMARSPVFQLNMSRFLKLMRYLKKDKRLWKIQALAGLQSRPPHTASLITFSMESQRSWLIRSRVILPVFQRTRKFGRRLMLSGPISLANGLCGA